MIDSWVQETQHAGSVRSQEALEVLNIIDQR